MKMCPSKSTRSGIVVGAEERLKDRSGNRRGRCRKGNGSITKTTGGRNGEVGTYSFWRWLCKEMELVPQVTAKAYGTLELTCVVVDKRIVVMCRFAGQGSRNFGNVWP